MVLFPSLSSDVFQVFLHTFWGFSLGCDMFLHRMVFECVFSWVGRSSHGHLQHILTSWESFGHSKFKPIFTPSFLFSPSETWMALLLDFWCSPRLLQNLFFFLSAHHIRWFPLIYTKDLATNLPSNVQLCKDVSFPFFDNFMLVSTVLWSYSPPLPSLVCSYCLPNPTYCVSINREVID